MWSRWIVLVGGMFCWFADPPEVPAQALLTQREALEIAFGEGTRVDRRTAFLSREQLERARELAGGEVPVEQSLVTYYVGLKDSVVLGTAYFDAHLVRTLEEVVMVVVGPGDRIRRVEVLSFSEPPEYRAPRAWLDQLGDQSLGPQLSTKGAVVNLTGATLTSRALIRAARRVLALHRVIRGGLETEN